MDSYWYIGVNRQAEDASNVNISKSRLRDLDRNSGCLNYKTIYKL